MNRTIQRTLLLACLGMMVVVVAACVPLPAPVPATATPSNTITNIVWQWTSVANRTSGETTQVANPEAYTITFREDGTLSGQADCNTFTGTYSQDGGFTLTVVPDVMAACGGDSLDQQYLVLLEDIVAGGPDGAGGLALETAGGEQRMTFVSGAPTPPTVPRLLPRRPATSPTSSGSGKHWMMSRPAHQPEYPIRASTPLYSGPTGQRQGKLTATRFPEPIRKPTALRSA